MERNNGEITFDFPNDDESLATIVETIPENWLFVHGCLTAPRTLVERNEVARHMGFQLSHASLGTLHGFEYDLEADVLGFVVERKLPERVSFDRAGDDDRGTMFKHCLRIAAAFFRKGYRGNLECHRSGTGTSRKSAVCRIEYREGAPPSVDLILEWDTEYGGSFGQLEPFIETCRRLGVNVGF